MSQFKHLPADIAKALNDYDRKVADGTIPDYLPASGTWVPLAERVRVQWMRDDEARAAQRRQAEADLAHYRAMAF